MSDGLAERCNGNRLEEDLLDVQQCIGQANSNSFPESNIGMIGKIWLQTRSIMDGRGGRICKVLYSIAVFFSHLFSHWFAP